MKITHAAVAYSLVVAFVTAPLVSDAESTAKVHRVGFLMGMDRQPKWEAAFEKGLQELGWSKGQNITIEYLSADGDFDRLPELCKQMVSRAVDLILAVSAPETAAAKKCTDGVPIVFAIHGDPIMTRDVQTLAHPGGNITGLSQMHPEMAAKQLDLLKQIAPGISRVAVLWNATVPTKLEDWKQLKPVARSLGLELLSFEVRGPADFDNAFTAIRQQHPDALLELGDPLTVAMRKPIVDFELKEGLPEMFTHRQFVEIGGLASYGADQTYMFSLAARIVDKILKGAKPADIPVEQPTKFEMLVNLKTATALGLTIPQSILAGADEVIE